MKRGRDGTEIEEPEEPDGWTDEDRARTRALTGVDLPIIVEGPGWYKTRKGLRVYIDKVRPRADVAFNCAGHLYLQERTPTKKQRTEWTVWRDTGRWGGLGESPKDIVSKA